MRNLKLTLEYDGTAYHGWQIQPNGISVQEVIQDCLSKITGKKTHVAAASRTDAGVHALGQAINFSTHLELPPQTFLKALNHLLPRDIKIIAAEEANLDFHSQLQAKKKIYRYFILNQDFPSAFDYKYSWYIRYKLNLEFMQKGADYLIGEHDFTSFQAANTDNLNPRRRLIRLDIFEEKGKIVFEFEGTGFLKYMIRNIVGTLVEAGREKIAPARVQEILIGRDRRLAGPTAPSRGLFLIQVVY